MARSKPHSTFARFLVPALASCLTLSITAISTAEDWSSLRTTYDQLKNYMAAKKKIGPDERAALEDLQTKLDAYRGVNPTDPRPLAMDLQVAIWLGDDAFYDAAPGRTDPDFRDDTIPDGALLVSERFPLVRGTTE